MRHVAILTKSCIDLEGNGERFFSKTTIGVLVEQPGETEEAFYLRVKEKVAVLKTVTVNGHPKYPGVEYTMTYLLEESDQA